MEPLFNIPKLYSSILLEGLHYVKLSKGWSFPKHKHFLFEFIYCVSGTIEQWVNGQPHRLHEGDALIIKYGLYHETLPLASDSEIFVFHFDIDEKEVHMLFQMISNPVMKSEKDVPFSISKWVKEFIHEFGTVLVQHNALHSLSMNERLEKSVTLLRMQTRVLDFICILADYFIKDSEVRLPEKLTPSQIKLANEVAYQLETHANEKFQINDLAQKLGVHRSYLSNSFKQLYGISPREFLSKVKIRSAKQLLLNTDLTIEEIATKLDFSSSSHFSKFFLSSVGLSPIKFRNQQRKIAGFDK
jgi:AraC-like DNA-binding protein